MAAFSLLSIVPILSIYFYIRSYVTNQMFNNSQIHNEMAFIKANDMISAKLDKISQGIKFLMYDTDLISLISSTYEDSSSPEAINAVNKINGYIASAKNSQDISEILLYLSEENPLCEFYVNSNKRSFLSQGLYFDDGSPETRWVLIPGFNNDKNISLVRYIFSTKDFRYIIASIYIIIKHDFFNDILDDAANTLNAEFYMFNSLNQVILSTEKTRKTLKEDILIDFLQGADYEFNSRIFNLGSKQSFISYHKNNNEQWHRPDWTLVSISPIDEILDPINKMFGNIFIVAVFSVVVFFIFSMFFSSSITGRINSLIYVMRQAQEGKFGSIIIPKGSDEITELMSDFNYMIKKIEVLMSNNLKYMNDSRKKELMALQAQINPHFLYNTLDLINWIALTYNNATDISEIVQSLSKFYKLSLSHGKEIVSLSDEIEHVKAYLEIQNRRFEGAITLIICIEPELLMCQITKLSLQPVVENAIIHGFRTKNKNKIVKINAIKIEDKKALVTVWDNGKGIPKEMLANLLNHNLNEKGYGLSNVDERIKLYFGSEFGLKIESREGEYTLVSVSLPIQSSF
jgi:two-component system sensor histidine kinase YesM